MPLSLTNVKIFELAEITDFSKECAKINAEKCFLVALELQSNPEEMQRALNLAVLFEAASI